MPWWPMAIPSLTEIVWNRRLVPPFAFTDSATLKACLSRFMLQGVDSLHTDATPTQGWDSSRSPSPIARIMARLAVLSTPSLMVREWCFTSNPSLMPIYLEAFAACIAAAGDYNRQMVNKIRPRSLGLWIVDLWN